MKEGWIVNADATDGSALVEAWDGGQVQKWFRCSSLDAAEYACAVLVDYEERLAALRARLSRSLRERTTQ